MDRIFSKRPESRLSTSRLKVVEFLDDYAVVVAYNFRDKRWFPSSRMMKLANLHLNYEEVIHAP